MYNRDTEQIIFNFFSVYASRTNIESYLKVFNVIGHAKSLRVNNRHNRITINRYNRIPITTLLLFGCRSKQYRKTNVLSVS